MMAHEVTRLVFVAMAAAAVTIAGFEVTGALDVHPDAAALPYLAPPSPRVRQQAVSESALKYVQECEKSVNGWRRPEVDYPPTMVTKMDQTTTYDAAVDIRRHALPPGKAIDAAHPRGDRLFVTCVVGARLVPVDGSVAVDSNDAATEGGWIYETPTPTAIVEWAWTFAATAPGTHQVRLELRPSVQGLLPSMTSGPEAEFVTLIDVDATLPCGRRSKTGRSRRLKSEQFRAV
jgi:hypothetical protein